MDERAASRFDGDRTGGTASSDTGRPSSASDGESTFVVDLDVYSGPFEALLALVSARKLELTELSLSAITEEFLSYAGNLDDDADLGQVSAFLDVASILVEAKSAALLPSDAQGRDGQEAMRALQERDLLFARLLQYQAFSRAAQAMGSRMDSQGAWVAHPASCEMIRRVAPELVWSTDANQLARIAAGVLADSPITRLSGHRLRGPLVDLREQADILRSRILSMPRRQAISFENLCDDAGSRPVVVARFFALLVFIKRGWLQFRQVGPFEPVMVRWVASADAVDRGTDGDADDGARGEGDGRARPAGRREGARRQEDEGEESHVAD